MTRVGWLDCASGLSGDMLLGALADLAVDRVADTVRVLDLPVRHRTERTVRSSIAAVLVQLDAEGDQPRRTWADIRQLLDGATLPPAVRDRAHGVFRRIAEAEARAHGLDPEQVHFHEVGALDALVDVVAGCWGLHDLALGRLTVSPIALGGGTADHAHGALPVPGPAVVELLRGSGLAAHGGPVEVELCTPTGAALAAEWADASGPMPGMVVTDVGVGAGSRDLAGRPNVVRLVVGEAADKPTGALLVEANVDDLDPRVWPGVLQRLLDAGAGDAWLTPILMKKGRPAHTLHVLVEPDRAEAVRHVVFTQTSTIGLRETVVGKRALDREWVPVDVEGVPVRLKVARLDGAVVTVTPEWDDVAAAAERLGRPARTLHALAIAAGAHLVQGASPVGPQEG